MSASSWSNNDTSFVTLIICRIICVGISVVTFKALVDFEKTFSVFNTALGASTKFLAFSIF